MIRRVGYHHRSAERRSSGHAAHYGLIGDAYRRKPAHTACRSLGAVQIVLGSRKPREIERQYMIARVRRIELSFRNSERVRDNASVARGKRRLSNYRARGL